MPERKCNCANCDRHCCKKELTDGAWGICLLYLGTKWLTKKEAENSVCGDWEIENLPF
jgi:hypothetical protein